MMTLSDILMVSVLIFPADYSLNPTSSNIKLNSSAVIRQDISVLMSGLLPHLFLSAQIL